MSSHVHKLKMSTTHVPKEIELEIMKKLPVKSLIQFILVCKAWKSMIECSEFVARYRVLPTQPQHLMIRYDVGDRREYVKYVSIVDDDTFPQKNSVQTVPPLLQLLLGGSRIVDSSCGLLYLDGSFREPDNSYTAMVVLWNPSIRKSIAVALPTVVLSPFDSVVGFGVCPHTNDPKLVQITYIADNMKIESISCIPFQVMVFTLTTGEWRCLCSNQLPLPRKSIEFDKRFTRVIGQFIYWLATDRAVEEDEYHNLIMSFDLSNEEFREVGLPDSLTHAVAESCLLISKLKDSLAVVEYKKDFFVVWMMEHDDPKSFTNIFAIEVPHASITWILGFRKSGEPIFELLEVDRQDSPLVVYEPWSKHIKHLGVRGNQYSFFGSSYTESLLLLDHDDGHIIRCGAVKRVGTGNQVIYID